MTAITNAKSDETARRYWILATVTLATMLFAMTVTISYVVLPQMQGSLSATQDQIAWTVTFNLVATAVGTPASGWLADRFGRRNLMFWCVTGFSIASLLCGTATTLEELIFYRVMQGILGAPITPLSQAIILGVFERRQHSLATAIWGIGVVCGPIVGPTIGGFVAEGRIFQGRCRTQLGQIFLKLSLKMFLTKFVLKCDRFSEISARSKHY